MNEDIEYEIYEEDGEPDYDGAGTEYEENLPSTLDKATNLANSAGNAMNAAANLFNSDVSGRIINSIIENRNVFAKLNQDLAIMQAAGAEKRAFIKQQYEVSKSTLESINENINSTFEELKRFDVKSMNETQAKTYQTLLNSVLQQRKMSMETLERIFG